MPSFHRSRMDAPIPYCESITKLPASELLEEGTQCPNCYTEICPRDFIYLHRSCANIVCSSCFDSNISSELHFGICLICDSNLAEPCIDDAIPNWRFTYTNLPLPTSSSQSSSAGAGTSSDDPMLWSPLISPGHRFHSYGNRQPIAETGSNCGATDGLGSMAAELARLRSDLAEQRSLMRDLKSEGFRGRDINNSTGFRHRDNNHFQYRNIPCFQREDDTNVQPWYNGNPRNQYNTRPRRSPSSRNQYYTSHEFENHGNPCAQNPHNSPNRNRSNHEQQGMPSQSQRQQHARNRGPVGVRPYSQGQSDNVQHQPIYAVPTHYHGTRRPAASMLANHGCKQNADRQGRQPKHYSKNMKYAKSFPQTPRNFQGGIEAVE